MLQKRIINFCPISAHRSESIGQALEKCIRDWGIERVFIVTVDNAYANSVGIEYLRNKLNHRNTCVANVKYMHTRCVALIINLIVQEGVKYASMPVDWVRAAVSVENEVVNMIEKELRCLFGEYSSIVGRVMFHEGQSSSSIPTNFSKSTE
ncbi:hypothetical protein V6N13_023141 [Hibiscus sabdariffa]